MKLTDLYIERLGRLIAHRIKENEASDGHIGLPHLTIIHATTVLTIYGIMKLLRSFITHIKQDNSIERSITSLLYEFLGSS